MGVALITPFKEDDSVDYDALLRLVDYQLQNGTDFLCVLGTTAETPTLTKEEKDKIKRLIIERVNGRIPILLGVSSNCTRAVVETLKNDDMTGVDAVLVAVPYYNKPSQEGIYQHYKAIAEATDLPAIILHTIKISQKLSGIFSIVKYGIFCNRSSWSLFQKRVAELDFIDT